MATTSGVAPSRGMRAAVGDARTPSRSAFCGRRVLSAPLARPRGAASGAGSVRMMAVTKETKGKTVERVREQLEESLLLSCMDPTGITVKDLQRLRRAMPATTKVAMAKNTLVRRAMQESGEEEAAKWAPMEPLMSGSNLWFFVREEEVASTVKAVKAFVQESEDEELAQRLAWKGGVLDGAFVKPEDMDKLEKMPTKQDVLTKLGVGVKAVPTKLGRGVKAVPLKLGRTMAALRDKIEEEENGGKSRFDA
mmetsp:Transcript_11543/g.42227  ORF Transcript_11543/g.42227 Transcript_11543/m.42227 type:complete len:251 (-) Transcript_11543:112-864(-)|eukprot:scaffold2423_cov242-Prasinococcus_capsulatus_cf.AAC.1